MADFRFGYGNALSAKGYHETYTIEYVTTQSIGDLHGYYHRTVASNARSRYPTKNTSVGQQIMVEN